MTDAQWDDKLHISTCGREDAYADPLHHPYEATPYCVLMRLAESGFITAKNRVLDYGCGRGRVGFFLRHQVGCACLGVEYNEVLFREAVENRARSGTEVELVCAAAETFPIKNADCFYFFNPFSLTLLRGVLERIRESFYETPRLMRLFFYYPDDEYRSFLLGEGDLEFAAEISCEDLFPQKDEREKILVLELRNYLYEIT